MVIKKKRLRSRKKRSSSQKYRRKGNLKFVRVVKLECYSSLYLLRGIKVHKERRSIKLKTFLGRVIHKTVELWGKGKLNEVKPKPGWSGGSSEV